MVQISLREWQIASAAACVAIIASGALWWVYRRRPTPDEVEAERRQMLFNYGRIVDGMLLDGFSIENEHGETREMLLYQYEISGVVYECSQDITPLAAILDAAKVKLGMPCSIRFQPGSPENSVVVTERWSGLREGVPAMWPPYAEQTQLAQDRQHPFQLPGAPEPMLRPPEGANGSVSAVRD